MHIKPSTTVSELLQAGYAIVTPHQFEVRDDAKDGSIAKRLLTPAGWVAAGYLPFTDLGVHVACGEINALESAFEDQAAGRDTASASK